MNYAITHQGSIKINYVLPYIETAECIAIHIGTEQKRPRVVAVGSDVVIISTGEPLEEATHVEFELPPGFTVMAYSTGRYDIQVICLHEPIDRLGKAVDKMNNQQEKKT